MIRYIFFKCSKDDSMIFQISKIFKELFSKDRMILFSKVQMRFNFEIHFPNAHSNQSIPIQRSQDSIARFLNIPIKYQLFSKDRKIHISRSIQTWIKWKNGRNVEKNLGKIIGEGCEIREEESLWRGNGCSESVG